jgi:hypothetical protein
MTTNHIIGKRPDTRLSSRVGVLAERGWSCRVYYTRPIDHRTDTDAMTSAIVNAARSLPDSGSKGQTGDAFLILHPGSEQDYSVLCYWQNANELVVRVWTRVYGETEWIDAERNASFCIWDMLIMDAERTRHITCVLSEVGDASPAFWPDSEQIERDGLLTIVSAPDSVLRALNASVLGSAWNPVSEKSGRAAE